MNPDKNSSNQHSDNINNTINAANPATSFNPTEYMGSNQDYSAQMRALYKGYLQDAITKHETYISFGDDWEKAQTKDELLSLVRTLIYSGNELGFFSQSALWFHNGGLGYDLVEHAYKHQVTEVLDLIALAQGTKLYPIEYLQCYIVAALTEQLKLEPKDERFITTTIHNDLYKITSIPDLLFKEPLSKSISRDVLDQLPLQIQSIILNAGAEYYAKGAENGLQSKPQSDPAQWGQLLKSCMEKLTHKQELDTIDIQALKDMALTAYHTQNDWIFERLSKANLAPSLLKQIKQTMYPAFAKKYMGVAKTCKETLEQEAQSISQTSLPTVSIRISSTKSSKPANLSTSAKIPSSPTSALTSTIGSTPPAYGQAICSLYKKQLQEILAQHQSCLTCGNKQEVEEITTKLLSLVTNILGNARTLGFDANTILSFKEEGLGYALVAHAYKYQLTELLDLIEQKSQIGAKDSPVEHLKCYISKLTGKTELDSEDIQFITQILQGALDPFLQDNNNRGILKTFPQIGYIICQAGAEYHSREITNTPQPAFSVQPDAKAFAQLLTSCVIKHELKQKLDAADITALQDMVLALYAQSTAIRNTWLQQQNFSPYLIEQIQLLIHKQHATLYRNAAQEYKRDMDSGNQPPIDSHPSSLSFTSSLPPELYLSVGDQNACTLYKDSLEEAIKEHRLHLMYGSLEGSEQAQAKLLALVSTILNSFETLGVNVKPVLQFNKRGLGYALVEHAYKYQVTDLITLIEHASQIGARDYPFEHIQCYMTTLTDKTELDSKDKQFITNTIKNATELLLPKDVMSRIPTPIKYIIFQVAAEYHSREITNKPQPQSNVQPTAVAVYTLLGNCITKLKSKQELDETDRHAIKDITIALCAHRTSSMNNYISSPLMRQIQIIVHQECATMCKQALQDCEKDMDSENQPALYSSSSSFTALASSFPQPHNDEYPSPEQIAIHKSALEEVIKKHTNCSMNPGLLHEQHAEYNLLEVVTTIINNRINPLDLLLKESNLLDYAYQYPIASVLSKLTEAGLGIDRYPMLHFASYVKTLKDKTALDDSDKKFITYAINENAKIVGNMLTSTLKIDDSASYLSTEIKYATHKAIAEYYTTLSRSGMPKPNTDMGASQDMPSIPKVAPMTISAKPHASPSLDAILIAKCTDKLQYQSKLNEQDKQSLTNLARDFGAQLVQQINDILLKNNLKPSLMNQLKQFVYTEVAKIYQAKTDEYREQMTEYTTLSTYGNYTTTTTTSPHNATVTATATTTVTATAIATQPTPIENQGVGTNTQIPASPTVPANINITPGTLRGLEQQVTQQDQVFKNM